MIGIDSGTISAARSYHSETVWRLSMASGVPAVSFVFRQFCLIQYQANDRPHIRTAHHDGLPPLVKITNLQMPA
ncbi:MAG: hypothetical protein C0487_06495 [Leptothrix sp. (in: Bacteria)]|nr:hypothetical protein [Leptothrix sp. (in: b-proteobacteria)]